MIIFNKEIELKEISKNVILTIIGIFAAAFGLEGFLLPNKFLDGGVTGISLLISMISAWNFPLLLVLINLPFVLIGYKQISKFFALKVIISISGLALCLFLFDFPIVTQDKLLISVFGGFFLGLGIGLSIRAGSVLDGTEVLALYLSKHLPLSLGDIIMLLNLLIFSFAAYVTNIETALYAILTYLTASFTIDYVIQGVEEYTGVIIISKFSEDIRLAIINEMGRGVTLYKGQKGYSVNNKESEIDIVFSVVTRLELNRIKKLCKSIDPDVFLITHTINETVGGVVKQRHKF